jgi:trigger factor
MRVCKQERGICLNYQVTTEKNWHTVIDVAIPSEVVGPQVDKEIEDYQKNAKIGGFRKGKVPASLIKKMFSKEIEGKIYGPHIQKAWEQIFKEKEFDFLTEPKLDDIQYTPQSGLTFKIKFDVRPQITLTNFENMSVDKEVYEISDNDVQKALEELQQGQAMIYSVEGQAQANHILIADLQELDRTGVPIIGRKYDNKEIWLEKGDTVITPQLVGVSAGEERRLSIKSEQPQPASEILSQEHPKKEQEQHYSVHVREIKERRVPDLNDEFAKDVGPYQTADELRDAVKNMLKSRSIIRAKYQFEHALEDEVIKQNDFEPPATMVNNFLDAVVKDVQTQEKDKKVNKEDVRSHFRATAIRNVKWLIIRQKLIDQLGLTVTDEEIENRIQELEKLPDADPQKISALRTDEKKAKDLTHDLYDAKIYSFLASTAKVNEIKKSWSKVAAADTESEEAEGQS